MILPENIPHYVNPVFYKESQEKPDQNQTHPNRKYQNNSDHQDPIQHQDQIKLTKQVKAGKGSRLSNIDGYNWRKYGEKVVRDCDYPRHYYKCSFHDCNVRKVCVFDASGQCIHLEIKGQHNHSPRRDPTNQNVSTKNPAIKAKSAQENKNNQFKVCNIYKSKKKVKQQGPNTFNDNIEVQNHINGTQKKRKISNHLQQQKNVGPQILKTESLNPSQDVLKELNQSGKRILIVDAPMEQSGYEDGYRYKKYGCKSVKDNTYPRNYYRCVECPVRRLVERWPEDPRYLMVTYEEEHTHLPIGQQIEQLTKKQRVTTQEDDQNQAFAQQPN